MKNVFKALNLRCVFEHAVILSQNPTTCCSSFKFDDFKRNTGTNFSLVDYLFDEKKMLLGIACLKTCFFLFSNALNIFFQIKMSFAAKEPSFRCCCFNFFHHFCQPALRKSREIQELFLRILQSFRLFVYSQHPPEQFQGFPFIKITTTVRSVWVWWSTWRKCAAGEKTKKKKKVLVQRNFSEGQQLSSAGGRLCSCGSVSPAAPKRKTAKCKIAKL